METEKILKSLSKCSDRIATNNHDLDMLLYKIADEDVLIDIDTVKVLESLKVKHASLSKDLHASYEALLQWTAPQTEK